MAIELRDEVRRKLIASIKRFFLEKLEEDIGDLKASLVLDYFLLELGPAAYNQAIQDAQAFMQDRTADLETSLYEPEEGYWPRQPG